MNNVENNSSLKTMTNKNIKKETEKSKAIKILKTRIIGTV